MRVILSAFLLILVLLQPQLALGQGRPPARVVVSPVVNEQVQARVVLIGIVEPWKASTVATEVAGKVDALEARRGARVKKGEVLAHLGKSDLLFRLEAARAKKNAARARLEKARDLLERAEKLIKGQEIPEKDYTEARLTVQELKENLAVAKAEIRQLEDELGKKTVRAPFNGVVTRELTEVGQWVGQGGGIVYMVDLSKVRILVDIPEKYVAGVKGDEEVTVKIDALGRQVFKGRVHALIPEGDREAHVFPLEVHVRNQDLTIKGGMLARVEFNLGLNRRVVMVHKDAIITRGSRTYLFVVNEGRAKQVFVATGQSKGGLIEVNGPLKEGEMVIIRGNERVRNGQPVEIVE